MPSPDLPRRDGRIQPDVLIAGAGPTGLVLALWATRQGLRVRILDRSDGPGKTSRAMAVQARTLELYRQLDLADAVAAAGNKTFTMNLWARGRPMAKLRLNDAGQDITPYPFALIYPQDDHERFLIERLQALGVEVERQTELLSFEDEGERVVAVLRRADGREERCEAAYLAGCDGASSTVRHGLGGRFEGGTYPQVFYVADVRLRGIQTAGEGHVVLDKADFVLLLAYGHEDRYRMIGTVRGERAEHPERLTMADVASEAIGNLPVRIDSVNWFSAYRVHHRVTDHFRKGRVFLLGDAAHVHSPVGGQGMNTGIADAINLAWKLAAVVHGRAADTLLDSYDAERRAFAERLVQTTDRLFTLATAPGRFAGLVRTRLAPILLGVAFRFGGVREFLFRTISQTTLNYRASPLSVGRAGRVAGGDRLPWVPLAGADNYDSLYDLGPPPASGWQLHVYGEGKPGLEAWCDRHGVALHAFAWRPEHGKAGLAKDAAYMLRPDSYVALADPHGTVDALTDYWIRAGLGRPD